MLVHSLTSVSFVSKTKEKAVENNSVGITSVIYVIFLKLVF